MTNISSQDFRSEYERFYKYIRNYLWPYDVLTILADVEVDIYSDFIDLDKLKKDLVSLGKQITDVMKDDEHLKKHFDYLVELTEVDEPNMFCRLPGVAEINPDKDKAIRTLPDRIEEDEE